MTTRAATFTAKIKALTDFHNMIAARSVAVPHGSDVANSLKYFNQTLLSILRDVPALPRDMYGPKQTDAIRLSIFPNLAYSALFNAVMQIVDDLPFFQQGVNDVSEALLNILACLPPFLEFDLVDAVVYTLACSFGYFPPQHHQKLIELICHNLFPLTLGFAGDLEEPIYTAESTSTIILSVFQHTENRCLHSKITEAIMSFKEEVYKDLFIVAAYGPPQARLAACCLLFHYWPNMGRRALLSRGPSLHYKYTAWQTVSCQRPSCLNVGNSIACKMILDPSVCLAEVAHPPPLFVCESCFDQLKSLPDRPLDLVLDVLSPVTSSSLKCQHPSCQNAAGGLNEAVVTCFSANCTSVLKSTNNPLPQAIRLCSTCWHRIHDNSTSHSRHVIQQSIPMLWECDLDLQNYMVDAIVASLREAQVILEYDPATQKQAKAAAAAIPSSSAVVAGGVIGGEKEKTDNFSVEDHLLLSRYGVWLLMEVADVSKMSNEDTNNLSEETIGRLVAMVFQWFNATAYLPDVPEQTGNALEALKQDHIKAWIQTVMKRYEHIVISCLLPQPPDYARVGRAWEFITSRVQQIKHGLNCLFCLMPYDLVTFEVWDVVIPYWLEAVQLEVPELELPEFKFFLSKMFNIDFGTLPFSVDQMFQFVSERLEFGSLLVQEQALRWLQILTSMSITVPLSHLTKMFKLSIANICAPGLHETLHYATEDDKNIPLTIIQKMSADHAVILAPYDSSVLEYYRFETIRQAPAQKKIEDVNEFKFSLLNLMLEILLGQMELAELPKHESVWSKTANSLLPCLIGMIQWDWPHQPHGPNAGKGVNNSCQICEQCGGFLQTFSRVLRWLCERQPGKIQKFEFVDAYNASLLGETSTAVDMTPGKAHKLAESSLAPRLVECFIDKLISSLTAGANSSIGISSIGGSATIIWRLLDCLQLLIAHDDSFKRYLSQESSEETLTNLINKFLPKLWQVLDASNAEIPRCAVACLLRCLIASDDCLHAFDVVVKRDFLHAEWLCRFDAVERAVNLCQLVRFEEVVKNQKLLSCLALVSYHLTLSIRDLNLTIVQRATILLGTLQANSIKTILESMLFQYRFCIIDRLTILDALSLLSATLQTRHAIITWDLVFQFIDALVAEIQANSDLLDPLEIAEHDNRLDRARFALSHPHVVRSLTTSLVELMTGDSGPPSVGSKKDMNIDRQMSSASLSKKQFLTADLVFQKHISAPSSFDTSLVQASFRTFETNKPRREVMHRTITFLMKFMSDQPRESARSSPPVPGIGGRGNSHMGGHHTPSTRDNFHDSKTQNSLFRLLHHLLGFNPTVRTIVVEPERFRRSVVFNAFVGQLPALVDRNRDIAEVLMPAILTMMQHCCVSTHDDSSKAPTLAPLHHFIRRDWLIALTTILYKYDYNTESGFTDGIVSLMTIVIATLHSATHDCMGFHSAGDYGGFHASTAFQAGLKRSMSLTNLRNSSWASVPEPEGFSPVPPTGTQQTTETGSHQQQSTKSAFSLFPRGQKKGGLKDILVEATKTSVAKSSVAGGVGGSSQPSTSAANDDMDAALAKRRCVSACSICGEPILSMSHETVGLCIVSLCAFIHREPALAAPLLLDALQIVARVSASFQYFWQKEDVYVHVPGNCVSVARQFIRMSMSQLQPNGIGSLLFASRIARPRQFFSVLASALHDYHELSNGALLLDLVRNLNSKKSLTMENADQTLANLDVYLSFVTNENVPPPEELDIQVPQLMSKISLSPPLLQSANKTLFNILGHTFRLLHQIASRDLLDASCKLVSSILHEPGVSIPVHALVTLFNAISRCYPKERDRRVFVQFVCAELLHVIRTTGIVNYANSVCLILFISIDVCRISPPLTSHLDQRLCDPASGTPLDASALNNYYLTGSGSGLTVPANVSELLKPYLADLMGFVTDLHAIVNMKAALRGLETALLEDVGGGYIKSLIAQVAACLLADATSADVRALGRHLPWLLQTSPNSSPDVMRQFSETLEHIRCLSWLLIGALSQMALTSRPCAPIATDLHGRVSDQILLVLSSYVDHETASVAHMTALFHAFLLCELWTLYVEQLVVYSPTSPSPLSGTGHICIAASEFWAKVTPTLIHLFSVTGERLTARLTELFTLHFVNLIESLQRARSSTLASLLPLWAPILISAFNGNLSGNTNVRLQNVLSWTPPASGDVFTLSADREAVAPSDSAYNILGCLSKLRFKLSQIEVQSSAAIRLYRV